MPTRKTIGHLFLPSRGGAVTGSRDAGSRARDAGLVRIALIAGAFTGMASHAAESDLLVRAESQPGQELAYALAVTNRLVVTGSPGDIGRRGSAHVFDCSILPCAAAAPLEATLLAEGDLYGSAVAAAADIIVVGAPGQASGAAYVFIRNGVVWTQQARLVAEGGGVNERFGSSLALEGELLAIGAEGADDRAGAVYVFRRNGTVWTQQTRLTLPDAHSGDRLGASVAVASGTLVAGAPFRTQGPTGFAQGSVHVFAESGGVWVQQAQLLAPVPADGELFGFSLDIEGDRILVGAPLASARAGMAHVFVRNAGTWSHDGQLSVIGGLPGDRLGWSVALAAGMAIAGAPYALDGCGAGYGFRRVAGVWSSTSETAVTMPLPGQLLGWSVAASTDGWTVGAPGYAGAPDHAGAAYWFQRADVIFASGFEVMPVAVVSGTGKCLPQ